MSILVTGGAGYIGGHMVLGLLDAGERPIVIDNGMNGAPWAIPASVPFIDGDAGNVHDPRQALQKFEHENLRSAVDRAR